MKLSPFLPTFALACLGTACTTTHLALEPLRVERELPYFYRTGWDYGDLARAAAPLPAGAPAQAEVPGSQGGLPAVKLVARVLRLPDEEARAMLGAADGRIAVLEVPAEDLERALAGLGARSVGPMLEREFELPAVGAADLRVAHQRAYIAAVEVERSGDAAIADPIIEVVEEGFRLRVTPVAGGATDEFEVELIACDLERPPRERSIAFPGTSATMTVEQPSLFTQVVRARAVIGARTSLLLAGIPSRREGASMMLAVRRG